MPLHNSHSIERTRVIVTFRDALTQKPLNTLAEIFESKRVELGFGGRNNVAGQAIQMSFGPMGAPPSPQPQIIVGWDYRRQLAEVGTIVEYLTAQSSGTGVVVYETSEYGRWDNFLARFENIALDVLREANKLSDIFSVSLEYYDRFNFEGNANEAVPAELLVKIPDCLFESAANGQELWHLHRGWFEPLNGNQVLVNQNFDAQSFEIEGIQTRTLQILTKTEMRFETAILDFSNLLSDLDSLHQRSKVIFSGVLDNKMKTRVGL